ncbi:lysophospholipid acyltransferase 5-like, partial [Carcharodon carcharias]|uniref:lysophospholipid acyltransferase 5-like n=1 Tax=Carcharodon carcharias TaxID=13397 RepID=UPI001B7EF9ED
GQLNKEQEQHRLTSRLTLAEVTGFAYFYGAFLVGPQFAMSSYLQMATGQRTDQPGHPPNSVLPALKRLSLGMFYLMIHMLASSYFPDEYFLTTEFANRSLGYKCLFITLWGKVTLIKYVTCWLVAEGVCILTGLGYNGRNEAGETQWDACTNIKVLLFETTPYFKGTIAAFNIQTNLWAA